MLPGEVSSSRRILYRNCRLRAQLCTKSARGNRLPRRRRPTRLVATLASLGPGQSADRACVQPPAIRPDEPTHLVQRAPTSARTEVGDELDGAFGVEQSACGGGANFEERPPLVGIEIKNCRTVGRSPRCVQIRGVADGEGCEPRAHQCSRGRGGLRSGEQRTATRIEPFAAAAGARLVGVAHRDMIAPRVT